MAIAFDKKFEVTKNEGVATVTYADKDAYTGSTDIPKETIESVLKHRDEYVTAATSAMKEQAQAIMSDDKDINTVMVKMPYGLDSKSNINAELKRSHTYPGFNGGDPVTVSTMKVTVKDTFMDKDMPRHVKSLKADLTAALLGK